MFESRISAGATEKLPGWENLTQKTVAWSYDVKGHDRKCQAGYQKRSSYTKFQVLALDDHQFKKEELESAGELSKSMLTIVLTCLYLARIGRPDFLWSVNKPARSVTKWRGACDRRSARLKS